MIAIIDYDAGNIKSVEKAMIRLGEERRFSESVLACSSCLNEVMRHLEWKDLAF